MTIKNLIAHFCDFWKNVLISGKNVLISGKKYHISGKFLGVSGNFFSYLGKIGVCPENFFGTLTENFLATRGGGGGGGGRSPKWSKGGPKVAD
jgi:hypothetical protein